MFARLNYFLNRQVFEKFCAQIAKMMKFHQAAQCKSIGNLRLIDLGHSLACSSEKNLLSQVYAIFLGH